MPFRLVCCASGLLMFLLLICPGCEPAGDSDGSARPPAEETAEPSDDSASIANPASETLSSETLSSETPPASSADASDSINLTTASWEEIQQCVSDNVGKVVVVDLWSTSCLPCIQELPHLGQLQRDHADDVVCISVSVDYVGGTKRPPEFYRERVENVLQECDVRGRNFLCTVEADRLFEELKLPSIPAVYVYNQSGELAQQFDASLLDEESDEEEPFTYERSILPLVTRLLDAAE